jgi:hypothetical protein
MFENGQDEPQSERSMKAYERGVAWANETFDAWLAAGRAIPPDLPFTESDAAAMVDTSAFPDPVSRTRMVLITFDAARLRWTRLVSLGLTSEPGPDIDPPGAGAA